MKLTSSAFPQGGSIPAEFTCSGKNISPPLSVSEIPPQAKSLALIMDDPDAPMGTFVHWVVWNIPVDAVFEQGGKLGSEGITDFGRTGYGGPCPPSGKHRYFFNLYALDCKLDLGAESTKKDLENAMEGHVLAHAQLMGTYSR